MHHCLGGMDAPASDYGKEGFITDEKKFYLNPPVNRQNDCVWSAGKSAILTKITWSLRVERSKFARQVMVSAGVCYGGMGILNFMPDKATLNAMLYVETLLSRLIEDFKSVLPSGFHSSSTVQLLTR